MVRYKQYGPSQILLILVFFEEQLILGSLEFAIHTMVETRMDMSIFDGNHNNDQTGRRTYDPKILLKVVLFAYSRGLISSHRIERTCRENVTFTALSGNQRPDHSTIAAFPPHIIGLRPGESSGRLLFCVRWIKTTRQCI